MTIIARIVPLTISKWNCLKGGGDTTTKLLDNCEEQIGIRTTVTTVASARLVSYFGVLFHRLNQWCNAKEDLSFYLSLAHTRHANNERASFNDSLRLICDMLLSQTQTR